MVSIRKYVISDDLTGRDLFYFEVFKQDDMIFFDSNLVFKTKKLKDLIELLISNDLPNETVEIIAAKLFTSVKRIKYYDQFYFDDCVLDKNGKLNFDSYKLLQQLNYEKLKSDGEYDVPISRNNYPDLFAVVNNELCIHKNRVMKDSKSITKIQFEFHLINEPLKFEYVNVYDKDNKFYRHKSEEGYDTYFILRNKTLHLAFRTK